MLNETNPTQLAREDRAIYRAMKLLEGRMKKPGECLTSTNAVWQFLALHYANEDREVFTALWLDAQNCLVAVENIFFGTLTKTAVFPREVVRRGLLLNAANVIFAHNHPSGHAEPSHEDLTLTCALLEALALVEICTHDHFIVAGTNVVSLALRGLLGKRCLPEPKKLPKKIAQGRKATV